MSVLRRHAPELAAFGALGALLIVGAIRYGASSFANGAMLGNLLADNAPLVVVAVGMTFVIIGGGIDLSVGAVMGLCSIVTAVLIQRCGLNAWAAFAAAVGLGLAAGVFNGTMIRWSSLPPFIVTLGTMFLCRGVAFVVSLEPVAIDDAVHAGVGAWSVRIGPVRCTGSALFAVGVIAVAWHVLRATRFGLDVRAAGGGETAARLMGIRVGRVRVATYAISGACAGAAGVLMSLYLSSGTHAEGVGMELDAIAAVVIGGASLAGGVGSVVGTLAGVLVLGVVAVAVTTYEPRPMSAGMTKVLTGGILLVFVLLQRLLGGAGAAREDAE